MLEDKDEDSDLDEDAEEVDEEEKEDSAHDSSSSESEEEAEEPSSRHSSESTERILDIHEIFPTFDRAKVLNFSQLFSIHAKKRPLQFRRPKIKRGHIDDLAPDADEEEIFRLTGPEYNTVVKAKIACSNRITLFQGNPPVHTSNPSSAILAQAGNRNILLRRAMKMRQLENIFEQRRASQKVDENEKKMDGEISFSPMQATSVMMMDWEKDILWDENDAMKRRKTRDEHVRVGIEEEVRRPMYFPPRPDQPPRPTIQNITAPVRMLKTNAAKFLNFELEKGSWEDCIIWDDTVLPAALPNLHPILHLSDPNLIFETLEIEDISKKIMKAEKMIAKRLKRLRKAERLGISAEEMMTEKEEIHSFTKPLNDKFNISNDKYYEKTTAKTAPIVKSSLRQIGVQHSIPALKLSIPYFKPLLSKEELRHFHRPKIRFPRAPISFSVLRKKSDLSKKNVGEVIRNAKKLTLKDASSYVLIEYCEEIPPLIMNGGMASLITNYYRKTGSNDRSGFEKIKEIDDEATSVSDVKLSEEEFGEQVVLEPTDASPFMALGDVKPGSYQYCIHNNLFKAPLFKHQAESSDFLLIKNTYKAETNYFLREIPAIFLSGQTIPLVEVFGPHSRKFNIFCKNRCLVASYRTFRKKDNEEQLLKISKLLQQFPQFSEGSVRKWLKEYAESSRKGRDSGWWKLKALAPNYSEDDLRKLVTPEMVCQYESMQAGQQRLIDAGLISALDQLNDEFDDLEDDDAILDDEVKNAPWITTRNLISASLGKTQLLMNPQADPTGRGEGFAFKRASNKKTESPVKKVGGKPELPLKDEIARIWKTQSDSLSSTADIPVDDLEIEAEHAHAAAATKAETIKPQGMTRVDSSKTDNALIDDDAVSVTSLGSSRSKSHRTLTIKRTFLQPDGSLQPEEEVITDPRIINAYLRQKQLQENQKKPLASAQPRSGSEPVRKEKKRESKVVLKCGSCGGVGHMRTNKICPNFVEDENTVKKEAKKKTSKPKDSMAKRRKNLTELSNVLVAIWKELAATPHSLPFHKPVNPKQVADYYTFITNPMDLSTIRNKLKRLLYTSVSEFLNDVKLMRDNCEKYNGPQHSLTFIINSMHEKALKIANENKEKIAAIEACINSEDGAEYFSSFTPSDSIAGHSELMQDDDHEDMEGDDNEKDQIAQEIDAEMKQESSDVDVMSLDM